MLFVNERMKNMKKLLAMLLSLMMLVSVPMTCLAATDSVEKKSTEFGTMTGNLKSSVFAGRKQVEYSTKTTKSASKLIVTLQPKDYLTGANVGDPDSPLTASDSRSVGDTWECHISKYNNGKKLSAFSTHEARGKTSLVGYTGIKNF